jgi:hypothetical protein
MADEISPTLEAADEKPEVQPETNEQAAEEDQLLATLRAASISKPEQLDGALRNAGRTFQMQSERDKLANELEQIRQQMAAQEKQPNPENTGQFDDDNYGQPVNLQLEIRKALQAEEAEKQRKQSLIQEQQMKAWNTIQNDPDFGQVESIWSERLKDPNFVYQVQTGQVDPVMEYHGIKSEYFKGLMREAVGTIETLQRGGAPQPHVESGDARMPAMEVEGDESEHIKIIDKLRSKAESGAILTEDEELQLLQSSLLKPQ